MVHNCVLEQSYRHPDTLQFTQRFITTSRPHVQLYLDILHYRQKKSIFYAQLSPRAMFPDLNVLAHHIGQLQILNIIKKYITPRPHYDGIKL
jgi:hypothetical protein